MSDKITFIPPNELICYEVVSTLSETADWGLSFTGVIPEAHKRTKGQGIVVAVLDTGLSSHVDLTDNVLGYFNFSDSNTSGDVVGHGTHVAGTIAALQNGIGVLGVAPETKIYSIKVLDDDGSGSYDNITAGIEKAIELDVDIINMSLGSEFEAPQSFYDAIKKAYNAGIIILAAAGNDSGSVNYPAKYPEVIAVSAIDDEGKLAYFSSRGPEVVLAAPGVDIYSTYPDNQYAKMSGTSMATPFASGLCALLLSWRKTNTWASPINNTQDMIKYLDALCDPFGTINYIGKAGDTGYGIPQFVNFTPWQNPPINPPIDIIIDHVSPHNNSGFWAKIAELWKKFLYWLTH